MAVSTDCGFEHLGTYSRGLMSDLARKGVEPIALAAGAAGERFRNS